MSVLKQPYASPSRVRGVYRYLLHAADQTESRETLEAVLSPPSLQRADEPAMLRAVVAECEKMGLVQADGERLRLPPELPAAARDPSLAEKRLPLTLWELFLRANEENHDLLRLLAWYLAQPVETAPGDWESFQQALDAQVGTERLGLRNDLLYGQFNDWACYLGFAWCHARRDREWLVPDPTAHLRRRLRDVFESVGTRLIPAQAVNRLAELCPILEKGSIRTDVEREIGLPELDRTLSGTTAQAWLRLDEEGLVKVEENAADANHFDLPDGGRSPIRCSALIWLNAPGGE